MSFDPHDFNDLADLAGMAQRREANQLLHEQAAEQARIAALPDCPFCGGKIPKQGVSICTHCRKELAWVAHIACEPNPEAIARAKLEVDREFKRRQFQRESEQRQKKSENDDWEEVTAQIAAGFLPIVIIPMAAIVIIPMAAFIWQIFTGPPKSLSPANSPSVGHWSAGLLVVYIWTGQLIYLGLRCDKKQEHQWSGFWRWSKFTASVCGATFYDIVSPHDDFTYNMWRGIGNILIIYCVAIPGVLGVWRNRNHYANVARVKLNKQAFKNGQSSQRGDETEHEKKYFVKRGKTQKGPFPVNRINKLLASGKLRETDLHSESQDGPWKPLNESQL